MSVGLLVSVGEGAIVSVMVGVVVGVSVGVFALVSLAKRLGRGVCVTPGTACRVSGTLHARLASSNT